MQPPSPELYRDLVEFAPDALILVDAPGTILYANSHAHTLFGYEAGQLTGLSVETLIPEESRQAHRTHRRVYLRDPRLREMGNRTMPLQGLRKDGTRFRAEIRLAPIRTAAGILSAAAVRDATESEHVMSMLAAARQSAEEANDAKNRLLAAASHDLRQPLQSLRLLTSTLKLLVHDANVSDVIDQEERALNTMSELLHALLNIAKLESGTVQPTVCDVPLAAIFADLRQQFSSLAKLKNLDLVIDTLEVHVRTDPVLLSELLQNLLANAIRYTDSGRVELRCRSQTAGPVLIEVEDTGIGIPPALKERIFDDFFQAAPRDHSHRGGTGLGLGIVRRLSRALSLPVRVESTVDVGTQFTVEVPAGEQIAATPVGQAVSSTTTRTKGERILLVEDDRGMRDALKIYLELDEYEVRTAASMGELDQLLDTLERPPAVVISDFHLGPHERGSDAIERIRVRFQRPLPAILLTGDTSAVPARIAGGAGIRMLNKPVDAQRLTALVDELLCPRA